MNGMFKKLEKEEVGVRVNTAKENGLSLVLYIDARTVMEKLDEAVGPMNWKKEHRVLDGKTYCSISIRNAETGEWISKEDVGCASKTEAEKGEVSDSLKRAGVCWGIGRELYTAPFIWVKQGGFLTKYDTFKVTGYESENGVITFLKIRNEKTGKEVFSYGKPAAKAAPAAGSRAAESLLRQARELMARDGIDESDVTKACAEACGKKFGIRPDMKLDDYPENFLEKVILGRWDGIKRYLMEQKKAA